MKRSLAKNLVVKNWLRELIQIHRRNAMKLAGDFLAAITLTVPFTAIC